MSARSRRPLTILALVGAGSLLACGARTGLVDVASDVQFDAAADAVRPVDGAPIDTSPATPCSPVSATWSSSIVVEAATSYAIAGDPRCGVFIASGDARNDLSISTLDAHGSFVREPIGLHGAVVSLSATSTALHLLFHDGAALRYVARRDGLWGPPESIDAEGLERGELAVDAAGRVHVVYTATAGKLGELRYAHRDAGWSIERVDARSSFEPSLTLDRDGAPIVAYEYVSSPSDHGCVVSTRTAGRWSSTDLPRVDDHWSSAPCTVRASRDGVVHVTFGAYRSEGNVFRHGFGAIGALRFETIERLGSFGADPWSAALDSTGTLHVAYRAAEPSNPLHAAALRATTPAAIETVPDAIGAGGVLVALDGADVVHLTFVREGKLVHAQRR